MLEPQDDVKELDSDDVEFNGDLFKDQHGHSIEFFLHESIKKKFSQRNLTRDIERHGGIVRHNHYGCDTVLVDVLYGKKEILQTAYNVDNDSNLRKVFVEFAPFVQHCIQNNLFVHRIPPLKGMGGTVGVVRMPFTEHDDESLCYYIARILPDKAAGGRFGLAIYKRLVEMAAVSGSLAWGARHTAESWKERYKKNAISFDSRIEDIVKLEGRSRKQLWPADRRVGHKFIRGKHRYEPEEPSEEDYEEELSQPSQKRRRSEFSSSPPNKQRRPSYEKGKARAEEEEEEGGPDESDIFEGLFTMEDEDEPGPSRSRRSLEPTTVTADELTHRTQPNSASFFTQETIVASAPSGRSVKSKGASHFLDEAAESVVRPSIQVSRGVKQASLFGHEPIAVIDLTPPSRPTGRNSPVIQQFPERTLVNPPQTQATQPSTYKRPVKAARRPRAMIEAAVPADAPYKNTRSRSQSIEPSTSNSPVRVLKEGGKKGKQRAMPELATVDEIRDDRQGSEHLEVANEFVPASVGEEIFANEIEVEKMLIEDDDEEPDDVNQFRGVSLDTDDAQTEQNLRPTQPPRQIIPSFQKHPSEVLKEFQAYSAIWTGPSHLSNNRPAVRVRNTQENAFSIPSTSLSRNGAVAYKAAEPPRTPLTRPRENSASSMELFPVSGTRASALKKTIQQQEKRNPYNPPTGTRAAQFARSRN